MVAREEARYLSHFAALTPTQRAVLTVLLEGGSTFSPFGAATLKAVGSIVRRSIATSTVQGALNKMRGTSPPLIWLSNRGDYAIEDQGMVAWYRKQVASGTWPPPVAASTPATRRASTVTPASPKSKHSQAKTAKKKAR